MCNFKQPLGVIHSSANRLIIWVFVYGKHPRHIIPATQIYCYNIETEYQLIKKMTFIYDAIIFFSLPEAAFFRSTITIRPQVSSRPATIMLQSVLK